MKLKHITVCGILLSSLVFGACSVDGHHSEHHSKHTQTEKVKSHHKDVDKHKKHDDKKHHDKKHDNQADQKNKDKQNQQAQQDKQKQAQGDHSQNGPYGVNAKSWYANGRWHSSDPWIDWQYAEEANDNQQQPGRQLTPEEVYYSQEKMAQDYDNAHGIPYNNPYPDYVPDTAGQDQ